LEEIKLQELQVLELNQKIITDTSKLKQKQTISYFSCNFLKKILPGPYCSLMQSGLVDILPDLLIICVFTLFWLWARLS
jgi:hypothetical protein